MNELLLVGSLVLTFGCVLLSFLLFGKAGLYCMSVICTLLANIEVTILVNAFGMEQTLGNMLFAATFLITDILSECYGRRAANRAVMLGIFASVFFLVTSLSWLLYMPSENDFVSPSIHVIFSSTPRMIIASLLVYAICQFLDVWLYHKWWNFTTRKLGDSRKALWLRNNGSTLISQLVNVILFNVFAFAGTYDAKTLVSVIVSCYVIYIFTSLLDTPVIYAARMVFERRRKAGNF